MEERSRLRWQLVIGVVITGTALYYTARFQNRVKVKEQCPASLLQETKSFYHPFVQTFLMFLGELMCLPLYYFMRKCYRREFLIRHDFARMSDKRRPNPFLYAIPALCDLFCTILEYIAISMTTDSTQQFMRNGMILTTALFVRLLTKVAFKRNQIFGGLIALLALVIASLPQFFDQEPNQLVSSTNSVVGVIIILVAIGLEGFFLAFEQYLFQNYHIQPIELVGMEGLFGTIFSFLVLILMSYLPCPFDSNDVCVCSNFNRFAEGALIYLQELDTPLILLGLAMIISVAVFNVFGTHITKLINAVGRCIAESSRAILIWGIGMILNLFYNDDEKFERTDWLSISTKIVSFMVLIVALLVYNEVILAKKKPLYPLVDDHETIQRTFL